MGGSDPSGSLARPTAIALAVALVAVLFPTTMAGPDAVREERQLPANPAEPADEYPKPLIEPIDEGTAEAMNVVEPGERSLGYPASLEKEIHPGRQLRITIPDSGSYLCTMNFVYEVANASGYEPSGDQPDLEKGDKLIGTAGHCVLRDWMPSSEAAGFQQPDVSVCAVLCVGSQASTILGTYYDLGNVLYAQQENAEGTALGEDYAFVKVPESFEQYLDPEMPVWSGPTDVRETSLLGEQVATYGQSGGFGDAELDPRIGVSQGDNAYRGSGGAFHQALPGFQGDSGGPIVALHDPFAPGEIDSQALGDLTHIIPEGSIVGTYSHYAVDFTEEETGVQLEMVTVDETNLGANTPVASS